MLFIFHLTFQIKTCLDKKKKIVSISSAATTKKTNKDLIRTVHCNTAKIMIILSAHAQDSSCSGPVFSPPDNIPMLFKRVTNVTLYVDSGMSLREIQKGDKCHPFLDDSCVSLQLRANAKILKKHASPLLYTKTSRLARQLRWSEAKASAPHVNILFKPTPV